MLKLNKQTEIPKSFGGDIKLHAAGPKQSNERDEILLLARPQHKHLPQYGFPLLQQLVLVTFGDKLLEQMDCVIWNGNDCGPS